MMRSYIVAATSISCILHNVNIANAGINERTCNAIAVETRNNHRTLYCKPSESDIQDIYKTLTDEYKKINTNSFKTETDMVTAHEAKSVALTEMIILSNGVKIAKVKILQTARYYKKIRSIDKNLKTYFQYEFLSEADTGREGELSYDWDSKKWRTSGLGERVLPTANRN